MNTLASPYRGYRFRPKIISDFVWLYCRLSLSNRDVAELMTERGVTVTYEAIRAWCERFGKEYAKRVRGRDGKLGDTWHLDEVFIKIGGRLQYLWRAVDQYGSVLGIPVQSRRSKKAAGRSFRKLLRGFKSTRHGQRFLSIFGMIADLYSVGRHLLLAVNYRLALSRRFVESCQVAGVSAAA